MQLIKPIVIALGAVGLFLATAVSWAEPEVADGLTLVIKASSAKIYSDGEAIVRRKMPGGGDTETYKLEFSRKRQDLLITFIHPTSLQGVEIYDNLKSRRTHFPKSLNMTSVEESPFVDSISDAKRKELLESNYSLATENSARRVGRQCSVIKLTPKDRALYSRRLWIDSATSFLLQQDLWGGSQGLETPWTYFQALSYKELQESPDEYELGEDEDTRIVKDLGGRRITDPSQLRALIGFAAPKTIAPPFGMVETSRRVFKRYSGGYSVYRIQLTDGIVDAWVWMWMTKGEQGRATLRLNDSVVPVHASDSYGVSAYVQGDAPESVLKQVAKSFVDSR